MNRIDFSQWTDPTDFERNELVFEKRNKAYGAYAIRKNYNKTLVRALVFSVFIILSLFMIPKITMLFAKETLPNEWDIVTFDMTPPEPTKKEEILKIPEEDRKVEKKSDTRMQNIWKVITDVIADLDTLTLDDINKLVTGANHNPGGTDSTLDFFDEIGDLGSGNTISADKTEEAVLFVTEMPEFIGGNENIPPYLGSNIVFPQDAIEDGKDARVMVGFIIEKDGSISNVKILSCTETGYGFEKEAIRVISEMPRWKPGKQNGHPARVLFRVPIFFRLM